MAGCFPPFLPCVNCNLAFTVSDADSIPNLDLGSNLYSNAGPDVDLGPASGYDSEAVGFESISQSSKSEVDNSTQTSEFAESGVGTQTNLSEDRGASARPEDVEDEEECTSKKNYSPRRLDEFLRRVVPAMMEQLEAGDGGALYDSSDSEDGEVFLAAKLLQEIEPDDSGRSSHWKSAGDIKPAEVLGVTWSSAGNSIAVSLGRGHHDEWCQHEGLIRVYTIKKADAEMFYHLLDISEKSCVTVLKYHPSLAALLAYGTISGEIVIVNVRDYSSGTRSSPVLGSPQGFHDGKRVTSLRWSDSALANSFLAMNINLNGRRRAVADQVLVSAGCDGTLNVWQVNVEHQVFQNVISYWLNGSKKLPRHDITCFDFIRVSPLRSAQEKISDDYFVVGTSSGDLVVCRFKEYEKIADSSAVDPVQEVLRNVSTCILDVAFSSQESHLFAMVSTDFDWIIYDVQQLAPVRKVSIQESISCATWIPNYPRLLLVGACGGASESRSAKKHYLSVYDLSNGRVDIEGLEVHRGNDELVVTALAVKQAGSCRVAAGDSRGALHIWDVPLRQLRFAPEDFEF
ncbi:WD repeat-containing protein 34 [Eumeta japonica]|uniref:WD repeat-containing protein 34 n=1 Tax=Eumeta variegata TaxID=151549 RepID=A0A4C1UMR9_EUMVA|nr:WD repeat-containing protein 34 [Eumeta japonica]